LQPFALSAYSTVEPDGCAGYEFGWCQAGAECLRGSTGISLSEISAMMIATVLTYASLVIDAGSRQLGLIFRVKRFSVTEHQEAPRPGSWRAVLRGAGEPTRSALGSSAFPGPDSGHSIPGWSDQNRWMQRPRGTKLTSIVCSLQWLTHSDLMEVPDPRMVGDSPRVRG